MAETKRNRNAQELKTSGGFRISRNPVVHITTAEERQDSPDTIGLPRKHGARILFAIARDPRTIFASWNLVCRLLLEKKKTLSTLPRSILMLCQRPSPGA